MSAPLPGALLQSSALPRDVIGRPLRDLRLSVIEACNFRCPYCMPADRIAEDHGLDSATRCPRTASASPSAALA